MKTAVITGGAGGLGRAFDVELRARGWATVLIDLSGPALDAVGELPERRIHGCDLTDTAALRSLCETIREAAPGIDLVIYNAGVTQIGTFAELSEETHRRLFEINYFAAVNMAQAFLPDLRRARGTHLAISSVAGFSPLIRRTGYAASKHALEGFFKSLRAEEKPYGVRCVIAAPSFVATNPGDSNRVGELSRPGSAADTVDAMTPEQAVAEILQGLERGRNVIPVGRVARLSWWLNRLSPNLFAWLMMRNIRED
jgi:Short-chain dehydrogenases of various substrate specificities